MKVLTVTAILFIITGASPVMAQQASSSAAPGSWLGSKVHSVISSPARLFEKSKAPIKKTFGTVGTGLRHGINGLRSVGMAASMTGGSTAPAMNPGLIAVPQYTQAGQTQMIPIQTSTQPGSMVTTMPNVFGGQNIYLPNGGMATTMPNVFGGQNIYGPGGSFSSTSPNVFGGFNYSP